MPTAAENFRVVCLGGSAGGLEPYLEILRNLPANTGMAFIVAPHRGVEHAHLLPQLLAAATAMPVTEVEQGMGLKLNHVFVIPPQKEMTIIEGRFDLQATQAARRGWPITVSILLFSLAESYRNRAVAVILSGMDHDGSAALTAIKANGGVTFAQSNPAVDSMPRNAVETGHVDFILPPAEIAVALLALAQGDLKAK